VRDLASHVITFSTGIESFGGGVRIPCVSDVEVAGIVLLRDAMNDTLRHHMSPIASVDPNT
jgi:hypothetical protein